MPKLLKLAAYDDPILHNKTAAVIFPLSAEDKTIIADMIYSIQPEQLKAAGAPWEAAVGMAANQWGINKSIFLYCPSGDTIDDLLVVINPSYEAVRAPVIFANSANDATDWEGCFSVPLASGLITRDLKIKIKFQDQNGTHMEGELEGWEARVWQHENDHLNGHLYDDPRHGKCSRKEVFKSVAEVEAFYAEHRESRRKEPKEPLQKDGN